MRIGGVRAGSLLVGLAGALALPSGASGQLDPVGSTVNQVGQSVQQAVPQAVPEVKAPAPLQTVTVPSNPAAPAPAPSAPQAVPAVPSAPAGSGSRPGAGSGSRPAAGSGSGSGPAARSGPPAAARSGGPATGSSGSGAARSGGKARASSSKASGRKSGARATKAHAASSDTRATAPAVSFGQSGWDTPEPGDAGSFTAGAQPESGATGDSRLPFTGVSALLMFALGGGALLAGVALRGATRTRLARRHGH